MCPSLPPEDLPPETMSALDEKLRKQLEASTSQHFFETCDGPTQALLMQCGWTISVSEGLMLIIRCSDQEQNWRVLNHIAIFAGYLSQFGTQAKIRVYPPSDTEPPFDMRVDERSMHQ